MANTFNSAFQENLVVAGTEALEQAFSLIEGVSLNSSFEPANRGESITVTGYDRKTATDVTPSMTNPTPAALAPGYKTITLNNHKKADFAVTGKEWAGNRLDYTFESQLKECVRSVVFAASADMFALYTGIPYTSGTANRSMFNDGTSPSIDLLSDIGEILDNNLVSQSNRRLIISPTEKANYGKVAAVQYAAYTPDPNFRQYGILGYDSGFAVSMDQQIPTHTVGTITTGLITKAATAQAVGTLNLVCTTAGTSGACALKTGDIVTVDGVTYALQADATQASAATDVTLVLDRGLEIAVGGSEAVTIATGFGTGKQQIAGDLSGFGLATRILRDDLEGRTQMRDAMIITHSSGLSMIMGMIPGYKQASWEVSMLYGCGLIDSRKLVRVQGK